MKNALARLFDIMADADTRYYEAFVAGFLLLRASYLATAPRAGIDRLYAAWLNVVPLSLWTVLVSLAAALIVWGLASPHPPTATRRRARAAGLGLAGLYYLSLAVVLATATPHVAEATMQWGLAAMTLTAAGRLLGLNHAARHAGEDVR